MIKAILVSLLLFVLTGCTERNSVGIIGGADGPTAIFVSSGFDPWHLIVIPAVIAVAIVVVWKVKK